MATVIKLYTEKELKEALAAQETAFKERVRNCLECRCGFPIHRESCPAINRDALEDQLVGEFGLTRIERLSVDK